MNNVKENQEKGNFKPFVITLGKGHGKDCGLVVDGKPLSYVQSFTLRADVHEIVSLHIERYVIQKETQKIEGIGAVKEKVVFGVFDTDMLDGFDGEKILTYYAADEMGEQWKCIYAVSEKEARRLYENLKEIFG